jgi:predicted nucleotidyltransferase component of viral defense system
MSSSPVTLPALPDRELLADRCKEVAAAEKVEAFLVEKDFYLTRLLWALGQALADQVLLKGGTLLSKVDLGFFRMSEDADLVIPGEPAQRKRDNAVRMNLVRDELRAHATQIGVHVPFADGDRSDKDAHSQWSLPYESEFGQQAILLEVSIRPAHRPRRRVILNQLLHAPAIGDYSQAYCWALDATEARAEKVRAALTREAIRDFYDLEQLAKRGFDLSSADFIRLVDSKLAEFPAPPMNSQPRDLGLTGERRRKLEESLKRELPAVLRVDAPAFDLNAAAERFMTLWRETLQMPPA